MANKGWYDINKLRLDNAPDDVLCSGAVAANMLYWWFEQNRRLIDDYVQVASHGVITSQQYGTRDVRTYIDSYITQEDNGGGFFYSIFEKEKLTDRSSVKKYNTLDSRIRQWLGEGRALGISHTTHTTLRNGFR